MVGRYRKPPRLYLRKRVGRMAHWLILDGGKQTALCLGEDQRAQAEEALAAYIERTGHEPAPRPETGVGYVYFLTAEREGFPIKIGFSQFPTIARLRQVQMGCPYPLVLLGTMMGSRAEEARLHKQFAQWRLSGEWFERTQAILSYVKSATTIERAILEG
jgi:hypothetical protein